ncbi:MAG: tetratricopeptide repeat protein [Ignavibacteriaceae bacterium]|nr:tetratricopeptide repeat protein [Ignavibacteriaceae bacterium]
MKRFTFLSLGGIAIIIVLLSVTIKSNRSNEKVTAFNKSITAGNKYDYKAAADILMKLYNDNKNDYLFNLRLGWLYYNLKDYKTSLNYYAKATELQKNSIEALMGYTLPLAALNDWAKVEQTYSKILRINPNDYYANLRLGQIYLNRAEYAKAAGYLETAYAGYPGEYEPNLSLGWTYYYLGKKNEAKKLFTNVIMLSENDSLGMLGLKLAN